MATHLLHDPPKISKFRRQLTSPTLLKAYFAAKLPLAAMAGLRVTYLDEEACEVSIPFKWRTQNPFGSIYFAALTMAAELSCAGLTLMAARTASQSVSVLPVGLEAKFIKKATDTTIFRCEDGPKAFAAVAETIETGAPVVLKTETIGRTNGVQVAHFFVEWSFKRRTSR